MSNLESSASRSSVSGGEKVAEYLDGRLGIYKAKGLIRKVFPEHWSFMFGEMALYSFIILILTGIYLTLFFKPGMNEVVYHGSYMPMHNVHMSEAYESTLRISFDVRAGLMVRQIHHWAALIMIGATCCHLLRHFFTGSFRRPRELNWVIGFVMLILLILEGFAGYSLPDDLLSGTGLRIAEGVVLAMPLVGSYLSSFMFGGEFPGHDVIGRLYSVHILLVPGLLLGMVVVHVVMVGVHKHTQFPGPGRTEKNVVGQPLLPVYVAKAGGFFFLVLGVIAACAALVQINPIWLFGPYRPDQISAGSQPDWYMGFLEGALRIFPNWEIEAFGHTLALNILVPAMVLPGLMAGVLLLWPFLESWVTGDRREHHLLDRPRDHPTRTAFGVAWCALYLLLLFGGANDILADRFHLSINEITNAVRVTVFVVPPLVYIATRRICLGLQRRDRDKVLHGRETGMIHRLPHGEYIEIHAPLPTQSVFTLVSREVVKPLPKPVAEIDGVRNPNLRRDRVRYRLSRWLYGSQIEPPTRAEYHEALSHNGHANGHLNGHANGHLNGHANGHAALNGQGTDGGSPTAVAVVPAAREESGVPAEHGREPGSPE